jgi:cytochrome c biogenesis protein CcmG/thiol:disulfide interchange protein DsbE
MRGRRLPLILIAAALVGGLVAVELATSGGGGGSSRKAAPALPKAVLVAPGVTLRSLAGRPAVVNFWASWCDPCRAEAEHLQRFAEHAGGRARLVGVNWTDELKGARAFIRRYRWTFPNMRDSGGDIGNEWFRTTGNVAGLPVTYVLDAHGRIASVLRGPQTEAKLDRAVRDAART